MIIIRQEVAARIVCCLSIFKKKKRINHHVLKTHEAEYKDESTERKKTTEDSQDRQT